MKRIFINTIRLLLLSVLPSLAILPFRSAGATGAEQPKPTPPPKEFTNSIGMKFVVIEPGRFVMGSDHWMEEGKPAHEVRITKSFQIGKYVVTQAEWEAVMGNNPSRFKGPDLPVENVTWSDAQEFLRKLNERNDGYIYRLPTEAEWEYAARAGGNEWACNYLDTWYEENSEGHTHPVGQKKPNAWGLYDMQGNVWQWCQDWYDAGYYKNSRVEDPQGPSSGAIHAYRGGDWGSNALHVQAIFRGTSVLQIKSIGFRCVREAKVH
jgi:formylglycine-generating enzyme required for sulfatase activity